MKRLLAALMFFTRLPLWRLASVPTRYYQKVVVLWPVAGWLTGAVVLGVWAAGSQVLPATAAWIVALLSRLLLTGCLHEDGLADFCDGFGGGSSRERILAIMKDSHIGTYGVVGLVMYFLLMTQAAAVAKALPAAVLVADVWSKTAASQIIQFLPYARKADEAKARVVYDRMTLAELLLNVAAGLLAVVLLLPKAYVWALLGPVAVTTLMVVLMKRRIGGYTGDLCGATFLLAELSFYLLMMTLL